MKSSAREYAAEIEANAARMERMIGALFEFSRAGRGEVVRVPIDMKAPVDTVLRDLAAGGPLRAEVRVGELLQASGDATLLRQVWMNLLGNALKYSFRALRPEVEIASGVCGSGIEYTVRDNGVGFDVHRSELAAPFTQSLRPAKGRLTFRFTLPAP